MSIKNPFNGDWSDCFNCGKRILTKKCVTISPQKLIGAKLTQLVGEPFCSPEHAMESYVKEFETQHKFSPEAYDHDQKSETPKLELTDSTPPSSPPKD